MEIIGVIWILELILEFIGSMVDIDISWVGIGVRFV